jgi:hypothetical protein
MLIDDAAAKGSGIFDWHIPAIEFHHLRAHLAMNDVQRSFSDGGRVKRRQDQPQTSSGWLPGWCDCLRYHAVFRRVKRLRISALLGLRVT